MKTAKKGKKSTKTLINKLNKISHDYIRTRDGIDGEKRGYCFDCGEYCEGRDFQAGHFKESGASGAWLRYHPHNMHGQFSGCNMKQSQERVKINYTLKMIDKYGRKYVDYLIMQRNKSIKADEIFYMTMISLYEQGDEDKIVEYLESL